MYSIQAFLLSGLCATLHRWPFYRGQTRIADSWVVEWLMRATNGSARALLRGGRELLVEPQDFDGRLLMLYGAVDLKVIAVCRALLHPGDVFLDIGANYGAVGFSCVAELGDSGVVHMFEPQAALVDRIMESLHKHPDDRIHVHQVALLDRDGTGALHVPANHCGAASLVHDVGASSEVVTVKDTTLVLKELVGSLPLAAKVDIEGAEERVVGALTAHPSFRFVLFEAAHVKRPDYFLQLAAVAGAGLYGVGNSPFGPRLHRIFAAHQLLEFEDAVLLVAGILPSEKDVWSMKQLRKCRYQFEARSRHA